MDIKLVAIDLDDTLLDSGLKIAEECAKAIQAARSKGVIVTLATGRMYSSALPYAKELKVDVPLITYQGALVKNSESQEIIYFQPVPSDLAQEVINFFRTNKVHHHSYFDDKLYMENLTEEGLRYARLAGVEPNLTKDLLQDVVEKKALKIMAVNKNEDLLGELELALKERYGDKLNITKSKPYYLEISNRKANKGDALKVIADRYNVKREQVLAIGDSYNDLDMIKWAGIGVAMGNAFDVVKEAADYVTKTNEEHGVAEALYKFVL
ncbi:MAG: HAD family phosphatase [Syntrophomonadaceae bacterium]|nr:HAD family phosphatase [Syntrophomonadaceae bacterium]